MADSVDIAAADLVAGVAGDTAGRVVGAVKAAVDDVVSDIAADSVHPLAEGGVRFEEVYARMKAAEEREREKDARLARLEGAMQARQPQQVQFTSEQAADFLQAKVDRGELTPMQAANALSKLNAQQAAVNTTMQAVQMQQLNARLASASQEVNTYIEKVPALRNNASLEFAKVSEAAYALSDDMGLPVSDLRVQRAALRQVYGGLDRMASAAGARRESREASLPHTETHVGGSAGKVAAKGDEAWKKDVPAEYLAFWEKRGYSAERMKQEAPYVTRVPRKVPVQR